MSASESCSTAKLRIWYLFTFSHLHLKVPIHFSRHLKMQNKHKCEHEDPPPRRLLSSCISVHSSHTSHHNLWLQPPAVPCCDPGWHEFHLQCLFDKDWCLAIFFLLSRRSSQTLLFFLWQCHLRTAGVLLFLQLSMFTRGLLKIWSAFRMKHFAMSDYFPAVTFVLSNKAQFLA